MPGRNRWRTNGISPIYGWVSASRSMTAPAPPARSSKSPAPRWSQREWSTPENASRDWDPRSNRQRQTDAAARGGFSALRRLARRHRRSRAARGRAAIDRQRDAGDPARLVAGQKQCAIADIPAGAFSAEQCALATRLAHLRRHAARRHHGRVDRAGRNAVDADTVTAVMRRHRARQTDDGALRCRIEQAWVAAEQTRDRTEIDDRAAAAPDHFRYRKFGHQHDGGDVDAHRSVPGLDIDLDGVAARAGDADIVDEDVEPAPCINGARHDRPTAGGIADVALDNERRAALGVDQALGLFRPWRRGVDQRHRAPCRA